jgi:hypothetical protein
VEALVLEVDDGVAIEHLLAPIVAGELPDMIEVAAVMAVAIAWS